MLKLTFVTSTKEWQIIKYFMIFNLQLNLSQLNLVVAKSHNFYYKEQAKPPNFKYLYENVKSCK